MAKSLNPQHRFLYKVNSRNLHYAIFDEENKRFIGIREKFGQKFLEEEYLLRFVFVEQIIEKIPDEIELKIHHNDIENHENYFLDTNSGKRVCFSKNKWYYYETNAVCENCNSIDPRNLDLFDYLNSCAKV